MHLHHDVINTVEGAEKFPYSFSVCFMLMIRVEHRIQGILKYEQHEGSFIHEDN